MYSKYFYKATFLTVVGSLFLSFSVNDIQKKAIRNKEFDILFYVYLKEKKLSSDKTYYWYRSGEIHKTQGNSGGLRLHSEYTKYHKNNQLAEKGEFKYGLKTGVWKRWHDNGMLEESIRWVDGKKSGPYTYLDKSGDLLVEGKYKKNKKVGAWVDYNKMDTLWYKIGVVYDKDPKKWKWRNDTLVRKDPFLKGIFKKKDTIQMKKPTPFLKRIFKRKKDSIN